MTTLLTLIPGDDFVYTATVDDALGVDYNLTGSTLWLTVKRRVSDADDNAIAKLYWISGGAASGITVGTPTTGSAVIRLTAAQTAAFAQASHVWDLQHKDAAGVVRTVGHGVLMVLPRSTARVTTP